MWAFMVGFLCLWSIWRHLNGQNTAKTPILTQKLIQGLSPTPVQPPVGLDSLPIELLEEIATYLDFPALKSFRKTNQRLREATNTRRIWYAFTESYCNRYSNLPHPENGHLETLPIDELRQWIKLRFFADEVWRTPNVCLPCRRTFPRQETTWSWDILPGGRWFLSIHKTGAIDYYDLDSSCFTPISLFCPKERNIAERQRIDRVGSWYGGTPFQGFLISVSNTDLSPGGGSLFIKRITCVGQGKSSSLNLQTMSCIPEISRGPITHGVGINDEIAIRHASYTPKRCPWIEVFRWRHCTKRWVTMSAIQIADAQHMPLLFPVAEDRVLSASKRGIKLYKIPPFRRVKWEPRCDLLPNQWNTEVTKPIWKYDDAISTQFRDPPAFCLDGTSYRLVFRMADSIIGVLIPSAIDEAPYVQFRISYIIRRPIALGIFKSISISDKSPPVRFSHGWINDKDTLIQGEDDQSPGRYYWFDEQSGRCIALTWETTFLVFDFVPYIRD